MHLQDLIGVLLMTRGYKLIKAQAWYPWVMVPNSKRQICRLQKTTENYMNTNHLKNSSSHKTWTEPFSNTGVSLLSKWVTPQVTLMLIRRTHLRMAPYPSSWSTVKFMITLATLLKNLHYFCSTFSVFKGPTKLLTASFKKPVSQNVF